MLPFTLGTYIHSQLALPRGNGRLLILFRTFPTWKF
jgi:hypothetical protein